MDESTISQLILAVRRSGFCLFSIPREVPLESLAHRLGNPVASVPGQYTVDIIRPKSKEESRPGTLSFIHGTDSFPFHTETAHWRHPVDWVILRCISPGAGNRPTLLIDGWSLALDKAKQNQLTQGLMVVRSGSRSFLAPLAKWHESRLLFRHDSACMRPASKYDVPALRILESAIAHAKQTAITWEPEQCVVFDNRRIFHSRAVSSISDPDRQLERVYVVREGD